MKKIFVVWGSEDGNLGVYSTFKKAYERTKIYLEQNGGKIEVNYQQALKRYSDIRAIGDNSYVSIQQFFLNAI